MPRNDDRYANTRLYVGHLSSRTRTRDLESLFSRYGRVRDVDMKHDFAFVEFSDPRDADDARYNLNGHDIDGSRIIVEFAKGGPRGSGGSREYLGRGPPPGSGRCFNCGIDGHWARDCKAGDWKNKCYRCGERGHIERNCQNSPRKLGRSRRSDSRSPVRPRHGRSRSRSYSSSRSHSRSRSPPNRRRDREIEAEKRRSRSPEPKKSRTPPTSSKPRKRSTTPEESRPRERSSPEREEREHNHRPRSPVEKSRSPVSCDKESPVARRYRSPSDTDGRSRSQGPGDQRSRPVDEANDSPNTSPRGIQSP